MFIFRSQVSRNNQDGRSGDPNVRNRYQDRNWQQSPGTFSESRDGTRYIDRHKTENTHYSNTRYGTSSQNRYNNDRYNDRRYNNNRRRPGGINAINNRNRYNDQDQQTAEELWRPDLLGDYRQEYGTTVPIISVQTGLGTIQGFYVNLFDGPGVVEGDRPENTPLDRIKRVVRVFLGIPYAEPPIGHNRFKVRIHLI